MVLGSRLWYEYDKHIFIANATRSESGQSHAICDSFNKFVRHSFSRLLRSQAILALDPQTVVLNLDDHMP
jgi:hypothetical protein